jgi:hypothetical protein
MTLPTLLLALLTLAGAPQQDAARDVAQEVNWHGSIESARAAAVELDRPLLIVFR